MIYCILFEEEKRFHKQQGKLEVDSNRKGRSDQIICVYGSEQYKNVL